MDNIEIFNKILQSFNIEANCVGSQQIDNYSYYDLRLAPTTRVKEIQKYGDEISLALKMPSRPRVKVMHQQGIVRLEFVSFRKEPLLLFDLFTNDNVPPGDLLVLLGQTVDGQRFWMDLAQNPHMIVAGTTGSGKSTLLHNIIANCINYNNCILHLVDPKRIEFHEYEKRIKRNMYVHYTYDEAIETLNSLLEMMEQRYLSMRNGQPASELPYVVLMIDEFADLIMQDRDDVFFIKLCRLAQKSRAARISIILATQRPSVNIINGAIKANFPARIACRVASHVDSKVILDSIGAESLLGKGDALVKDNFRFLERFQVAYTTASEVCQYFGE
jgi:DNA segregation ATPase FtsK/SpoIIIE, S-DNA-T family